MTPLPGPSQAGGPHRSRQPGQRRRAAHAAPRHARTGGRCHSRTATATMAGTAAFISFAVVILAAAAPIAAARTVHHAIGHVRHQRPTHRRVVSHSPIGPVCPLTGELAPGGAVPHRPALAVKVDNYPTARPQSALNQADIVFEEPVEGAITRLVAVFQCSSPSLIGPIRSAREPDVAIADELSHPLLVHAGGINPILALLNAANLTNIDVVFQYSNLTVHPSGRYAPYDTYVSARSMWNLAPSDTTPPAPLFSYRAAVPDGGTTTSSVHIPFSSTSDVTWTWVPGSSDWQLSYAGQPATTLSGSTIDGSPAPVAAANVVAMHVHTFSGPWVENSLGAHEVEVHATGSGPVVVLRNGVAISGTWRRSSLSSPMVLVDRSGATIPLAPGVTWVELVPSGIPITTAAPAGSGSTAGSSGSTPAG